MNDLTERERAILTMLAEGKRDKEIAEALGLHRHTITNRVTVILDKLGARTRAQAVAMFVRL